jgi:hypothetical protein
MKSGKKVLFASWVLLMVLAAQLQAQTSVNIVSTAVPFLRISPDARAGGMGDLSIATSPDANSPFYNASKAVFAKKKTTLALNYTPWL